MPASIIVGRFGGLTEFSRKTGYPTSTVWDWLRGGYVPRRAEQHVMDCARNHRVRLSWRDFSPAAQMAARPGASAGAAGG